MVQKPDAREQTLARSGIRVDAPANPPSEIATSFRPPSIWEGPDAFDGRFPLYSPTEIISQRRNDVNSQLSSPGDPLCQIEAWESGRNLLQGDNSDGNYRARAAVAVEHTKSKAEERFLAKAINIWAHHQELLRRTQNDTTKTAEEKSREVNAEAQVIYQKLEQASNETCYGVSGAVFA